MDDKTLKIMEENPEFDNVVASLVKLLVEVKTACTHGKTGVTVAHRGGQLGLIHEIREHTITQSR